MLIVKDVDDEATTFEVNPLGNRQRLKPRDSFLARNARQTRPIIVEEPSMVVEDSMLMQETVDESLGEGMYTMSDVVLPANAIVHAALDHVPAMPSLLPLPQPALMLLPKEIDYRVASPYYPPTESHTALPIASRRMRYIAVPVLALLALVVLGGAAMPPELEVVEAPAAQVVSTQEATSAPRVHEAANEPPAPIEQIEAPVVKKLVKKAAPRSRKVVVNSSTALGNLRPGRF